MLIKKKVEPDIHLEFRSDTNDPDSGVVKMTNDKIWKMKICLIGDAAVGKTSLVNKFVWNRFEDSYIATLGTKTMKKTIRINNNGTSHNMTLLIWDILGQKFFQKFQNVAYEGAKGAFIVVDLTREETLYSLDYWLYSLFKVAGEIPIVVLANKNDLKHSLEENEIREHIADYGFPFFLTSAKTGSNVESAFYTLGKSLIITWDEETSKENQLMPIVLKRYQKLMIDKEEKKLTPHEVEDMILARFCRLLGDTDKAMSIIRWQFQRLGLDFKNPTAKALIMVTDLLIDAASEHVDSKQLEEERRIFNNLIARMG